MELSIQERLKDLRVERGAEIACLFRPVLESNGIDASNYSDEFLTKVVSLVKGRVNFVKELWGASPPFALAHALDPSGLGHAAHSLVGFGTPLSRNADK